MSARSMSFCAFCWKVDGSFGKFLTHWLFSWTGVSWINKVILLRQCMVKSCYCRQYGMWFLQMLFECLEHYIYYIIRSTGKLILERPKWKAKGVEWVAQYVAIQGFEPGSDRPQSPSSPDWYLFLWPSWLALTFLKEWKYAVLGMVCFPAKWELA